MAELEWRVIPDFPAYEITAEGYIRRRGSQVAHSTQVDRVETVKLTRDGLRFHRSVNALVRSAFPELRWWELKR